MMSNNAHIIGEIDPKIHFIFFMPEEEDIEVLPEHVVRKVQRGKQCLSGLGGRRQVQQRVRMQGEGMISSCKWPFSDQKEV